ITKKVKATGLDALFDATLKEMKEAGDKTIVFTNFVDFDSSWGLLHHAFFRRRRHCTKMRSAFGIHCFRLRWSNRCCRGVIARIV
ncbi:hypothetical protein ONJ23_25655, partial [Salmonella enterica subsp. enterica serovar Virginia]|nr:hypothetical protein [Salmonella enterica subsp. enterica serovar Virginia]